MNNSDNKQLWWQPAVLMFTNISGWIVGPIILALIVGKYLDKRYNSEPWFFLGLTGLAFLVSIFGILKIMIKYIKQIEKEAKEKKDSLNKNNTIEK
ncbi:MAG: AtpZ/AtpI family protein [Candidatus Paceibacterota bacterium]|jgi:F0F1-type ATP synthase assembly protein I